MTTHYARNKHSMDMVIPIGIYCYFDLRKIQKSCEVFDSSNAKRNKRYSICQKPTLRKTLCETLFAGHISLQRRIRLQRYNKICGCARKNAFQCDFLLGEILSSIRLPRGAQGYSACTLSGKTITEIPEYDSGLMDKEKIEYSTTSRGNRRIFIYSANYRRVLDQ